MSSLVIRVFIFLLFCIDISAQDTLSITHLIEESYDSVEDKGVEFKKHQVLFDADLMVLLYRKIPNDNILRPGRLGLQLNFGYQRNKPQGGAIGVYAFWKGIPYNDSNLSLFGIKGRVAKPISEKFDLTLSPGIALLSNNQMFNSFPGYSIEIGIDDRKDFGVFANLDILNRTDEETDVLFLLGIRLKGKTATIASSILGVLGLLTSLAVSGSR